MFFSNPFLGNFCQSQKGPGRAGKGLSGVIFRALGGLAIGGSSPGTTYVLSGPMGLAEREFTGF